jgi:hypothetical protein
MVEDFPAPTAEVVRTAGHAKGAAASGAGASGAGLREEDAGLEIEAAFFNRSRKHRKYKLRTLDCNVVIRSNSTHVCFFLLALVSISTLLQSYTVNSLFYSS